MQVHMPSIKTNNISYLLTVHGQDEPFVMDDIAYDNVNERNADQCTSSGCMWPKSADGRVYVPYVIASHYCECLCGDLCR